MNKYLILAICLTAGPASAWTESKDFRGLVIYEAKGDGAALSLVCDPDGAMIPPENHLMMTVQGQTYSGEYSIQSPDHSFDGTIKDGTLVSSDGEPWNEVITVLRSSPDISISVNGVDFALNTEQPFPVACGSSVE